MTAAETGRIGENAAAEDYIKDGYTVKAKNYRTRHGEVDIILFKNNIWVFCEVKTRAENSIATPREWVNTQKQRKLVLSSMGYLRYKKLGEIVMRFDVVEVTTAKDKVVKINRIENAFDAGAYF